MYDQGTLSCMTRGLPATRHIARTLDTWQLPRQVTTRGRRHVADVWLPVLDDTWQTSPARSLGRVCREAHEALVEGDLTPPREREERERERRQVTSLSETRGYEPFDPCSRSTVSARQLFAVLVSPTVY